MLIGTKKFLTKKLYTPSPVRFLTDDTRLTRGAALTGSATGKLGTFSVWVYWETVRAADIITQGQFTAAWLFREASGRYQFKLGNTAGTTIADVNSLTGPVAGAWHHILVSWDLGNAIFNIYYDDKDDKDTVTTLTDDTVRYTTTDVKIMGAASQSPGINYADFYFNMSECVDITKEVNRRKFISSQKKPVFLGANGELPTGNKPIVFVSGDVTDWSTNKGTGGGFTVAGTTPSLSIRRPITAGMA